jgi:purine-nucleoside/S-methyl-5'-thioadenosine phosphorylase / adenosine deaminase
MPETSAEPIFLSSALFAQHGACGIFSLRHGGTSKPPFATLNLGYGLGDSDVHVDANIRRFLDAAALPMPHTARQCHGTAILACHGPGRQHAEEADILLAVGEQAAVGIRTADCVPILLADPRQRRLAAVHAGWRGTATRAVVHAVRAMQAAGSKPSELLVAIGPSIGPCCYAIGDDTAGRLGYLDPAAAFHRVDGIIHADLALLNARQLVACGIPTASIEHLSACTACQPQRFFSHRRDHGRTGRHLAVAAWPGSS